MKKLALLVTISLTTFSALQAQSNKKQQDIASIRDMCGCYEIEFKYTETFAPDTAYAKHSDYRATALEWAELITDSDQKLSIQHLLVINDTMVIKHWRQDWEYENQKVFYYDKDNNWVFKTLPKEQVKGQWTQKVFQVDDSPRYSGSATWVHADGRNYWENKTDSPLPRREHSKRSDYNVMVRGNRQEITQYGWIHEQDNDKLIRTLGKEDVLLAQEKGFNTYTKVPDAKCKAAKTWWKENQTFWATIRGAWDEVYNRSGNLTLLKQVDAKPLFMHFDALQKNAVGKEAVLQVIQKFIHPKTESITTGN
ncbi:DUF6607 family protein [Arenibacter sp. GZD96]|uniref:DUF6607 family protein n=1 Tax=Aurantibrevibacter litoralis TaxID=3106030 RepID=UPI002AFF280B|nr:DUF6607 family protein [Arenibacter sp. GZD-96]MEA1787257.1 DUF6607 family protein [Arenibacter sp. GZD-96]